MQSDGKVFFSGRLEHGQAFIAIALTENMVDGPDTKQDHEAGSSLIWAGPTLEAKLMPVASFYLLLAFA